MPEPPIFSAGTFSSRTAEYFDNYVEAAFVGTPFELQ